MKPYIGFDDDESESANAEVLGVTRRKRGCSSMVELNGISESEGISLLGDEEELSSKLKCLVWVGTSIILKLMDQILTLTNTLNSNSR